MLLLLERTLKRNQTNLADQEFISAHFSDQQIPRILQMQDTHGDPGPRIPATHPNVRGLQLAAAAKTLAVHLMTSKKLQLSAVSATS